MREVPLYEHMKEIWKENISISFSEVFFTVRIRRDHSHKAHLMVICRAMKTPANTSEDDRKRSVT